MKKLKAAILGYGRSGGSLHAGALEQNKDLFDVVAACDVDAERLRVAHARFGCRGYDDYHKMISAERPDLVIIVTRSHQHCQMTCDCLAAGVNVLVTKPWAVHAAEAQRMVEAQQASGKLLLPWLPARWGSDLRRLRELVASGAIGDVFLVRRAQPNFSIRCDWQMDKKSGGGYLLNWGPHLVDTGVLVTGRRPVSAFGVLRKVISPGDAEDIFFAALTLDNGALVTAEYTYTARPMCNWYIQGSRGTITVSRCMAVTIAMRANIPARSTRVGFGTSMRTV